MVNVKNESVLLARKLHTVWGPVEIQLQVFAVLPGDKVLILERIILGILGGPPNAEVDWTAGSKFERSVSAYRVSDIRRISLISPRKILHWKGRLGYSE